MADAGTQSGNMLADTIGTILPLVQDLLVGGPGQFASGMITNGARIGQFFGMNPAVSSMADVVNATQEFLDKKITAGDLADRGVQAYANWAITSKLEEAGWSPQMATVVAAMGSKLAAKILKGPAEFLGNGAESLLGNLMKNLGVVPTPDETPKISPIPGQQPQRGGLVPNT